MKSIDELLKKEDLLSYSQNFNPRRNYLGDRIFPDKKTRNLKASFYTLSDQIQLPTMALVHAFDTEARIGERPTIKKIDFEKLFIKEKINLSERYRLYKDNGVSDDDSMIDYIFNDVNRLAESVKTRTEVIKCELLQTGKIKIKENNVDITLDYGVPSGNLSNSISDMSAEADILSEIQKIVDKATDNGQYIDRAITSTKVMNKLKTNSAIQMKILGTIGKGVLLSNEQVNTLMQSLFGFSFEVYDEKYKYIKANNTSAVKRYIDETKIIFLAKTSFINTYGDGLWGVTPEEEEYGLWNEKSSQQYITCVKWNTADPVVTWTKASGVFIPTLPNPGGLFVATATLG